MSYTCRCCIVSPCSVSRKQQYIEARPSLALTRNGSNSWQPGASRRSSLVVGMATEDSQDSVGKDEGKKAEGSVAAALGPKFSSGAGFGAPTAAPKSTAKASKSKKPGKQPPPSADTIRRSPPPAALLGQQRQQDQQVLQVETAAVVSLGFLGLVILVEGLVLAASGFLPEEWDGFLVNVLYPSYTPTVGLFFLGAAGYGVYKYFGSDK